MKWMSFHHHQTLIAFLIIKFGYFSSVLDTVIFHPTNVPLAQNYNCSSFTSAVVNSILADMVASGQSGLGIVLTGDCAAPTGQGLTDKSTLISNGWSVTTN